MVKEPFVDKHEWVKTIHFFSFLPSPSAHGSKKKKVKQQRESKEDDVVFFLIKNINCLYIYSNFFLVF